jgi:hypothetical protein
MAGEHSRCRLNHHHNDSEVVQRNQRNYVKHMASKTLSDVLSVQLARYQNVLSYALHVQAGVRTVPEWLQECNYPSQPYAQSG